MTAARTPMPRAEAAALLGVPEAATTGEVQRAYLRAARRTHPDLLPEADDAGRREAGEAFARLTRARDTLLTDRPTAPEERAAWSAGPEGAAGPAYRQVPGRGLGGSLVVLALLAFLLIGIVSAEQAFRGGSSFDAPTTSTTAP